MSTVILMNHSEVLQDCKTRTWTTNLPGNFIKSGEVLYKPNAASNGVFVSPVPSMTAKIQSPKDKDHPMRDVSPELEIMEVRKVKRSIQAPIPITKAPMVKPRTTVIPNQSSPKVNPVPVPIQKRESFDMSMIDPALRGIGASCKSSKASISLASESRMLGLKRPAESMENLASKRLKEIPPLINQPSPHIINNNNIIQHHQTMPTPIFSPTPNTPQWQPKTWTKQDYIRLATAVDSTFNYRGYGAHIQKHPGEVADVFRGIVITPLLTTAATIDTPPPHPQAGIPENSNSNSNNNNNNTGESLMHNTRNPPPSPSPSSSSPPSTPSTSTTSTTATANTYAALKARAILEISLQLRAQIESELRAQLTSEGWVQLNQAKDIIAGYEREINTKTEPGAGASIGAAGTGTAAGTGVNTNGGVNGKPKIKPLPEAQRDLLAASIMFEKARKAEERRVRSVERAEREARNGDGGGGGGLGTGGKKLGRPRKGDGMGKGKGADFV